MRHVGVRLKTVIEDLSSTTGVKISCGKTKDDWRVRDIPVVVCVKDMPLGKVLRAIADATHNSSICFTAKLLRDD